MKDLREIAKDWLEAHGYDGLYREYCACDLIDFMPCDEPGIDCTAGYKCCCQKSDDYRFFIQDTRCEKCKAGETTKDTR